MRFILCIECDKVAEVLELFSLSFLFCRQNTKKQRQRISGWRNSTLERVDCNRSPGHWHLRSCKIFRTKITLVWTNFDFSKQRTENGRCSCSKAWNILKSSNKFNKTTLTCSVNFFIVQTWQLHTFSLVNKCYDLYIGCKMKENLKKMLVQFLRLAKDTYTHKPWPGYDTLTHYLCQ